MKTKFSVLAALAVAVFAVQAQAQQLIAWPLGQPGFRMLLPGQPMRPLPPQPFPRPNIPQPRPGVILPQLPGSPVQLSSFGVEGELDDQTATLTYHMTFRNPGAQRLEGVLLMPLPENAALGGFKMTVGGKEAKAELLEAQQASSIYEGIVQRMRDPGLLEMVGERTLRARVFPIEPNSTIDVTLTVAQLVPASGGLRELRVPLRSAQFMSGERGGAQSVHLKMTSTRPLRTLYSPVTGTKIERHGDKSADVTFNPAGQAGDFLLFYSAGAGPLSASALTYKEKGEDGFVLVSLSPRAHAAPGEVAPKDVVFILDRSGSMNDDRKIEQARAALTYCLGRLSPRDRFAIVDFATDVNSFQSELIAATPENVELGKKYVERIDAAGGTNIEGGLSEGLKMLSASDGRVPMAFFLTDGVPTVGQTSVDELLRQAAAKTGATRARLFAFGVGSDVNTLLLDKLSEGNGGAHDYVAPGEDIEAKVSTLYQKVAKPALTDVKIEWQGGDVAEVYPRPIRDVFYGSELAVLGRYRQAGKATLVVTGHVGGKPARFEFPVDLPERSTEKAFVPRLWANLKIAHELDAIRLSGAAASQESIQSIVKLAKRYGIITPYTSALITEDSFGMRDGHGNMMPQAVAPAALQQAAFQHVGMRMMKAAAATRGSGMGGGAGLEMAAQAQADSKMLGSLSGMIGGAASNMAPASTFDGLDRAAEMAKAEIRAEGKIVTATRIAGAKTFYQRGSAWIDGDYELAGNPAVKKLKFLSPEYFDLVRAHPDLKSAFALGSALTVMVDGQAYAIE